MHGVYVGNGILYFCTLESKWRKIKVPALSVYSEVDEGLIEEDLVTTQKIKLDCDSKNKTGLSKSKTGLWPQKIKLDRQKK